MRPGAAALLLLLWGCGENGRTAGGAAPATGDATLAEDFRIDGITHDLVPISFLAVHEDGTIAVTQRQDHRVCFFGDAGMPAGEFGTKGGGPGEFEDVTRLGWIGDTLWVYDYTQRRITRIGPGRQHLRDELVPGRAIAAPGHDVAEFTNVLPLEILADGSFHVMMSASAQAPIPEDYRDAAVFAIVGTDATVRRVLAAMKTPEDAGVQSEAGRASLPFANTPTWAASPDGASGALVTGIIEGPNAGHIAVVMLSAEGDTLFEGLHPFEPIPIPAALGDSILRSREQWIRNMNPALADAFRDAARVPPHHPPVVNALVGRDGTLWVQEPVRDGMRQYLVIATDGREIGRLRIPRNAAISVAERDRIWVLERDENDVQSIIRYRVDWSDS